MAFNDRQSFGEDKPMPTTWTTVTDPIGDTGAFDSRMIFGDFDGDGDIDILFQNGNSAGAGIGYMENNGNGTFTTYTDATIGGSVFAGVDLSGRQITPANFFILDFDGDGDLDILDRTSNTTTFFRNEGNAGFTRIADPAPDTGSFDQRMVWGDFDGDGDVDALYQNGNSAGSGIGFLRNDGGLSFTNFTDAAVAGTPFTGVVFTGLQITTSTFAVDIDDDGDMDILDRGTTQVMYRNDGGTFVRTADPLADIGSFDARLIFGDFDSDGDTDAIYQNGNVAGSGFGYFRNDGGTFTNFTSLTGTPFAGLDLTGQQLTTWTAVDIDGDGDVDIVDRDQAGGGLVLYRQNGAPPVLVSSSPSDNGTGVAAGANITLTFSESVTKGSGNIYIYRGDGTLMETIAIGSAQVTGSGTTWTIITGTATENQVLTADTSTLADSDGLGTLHYQWQHNVGSGFVNIVGAADQTTYTLGDADVGGLVRVVVSYTDGQGFANSVTSSATASIAGVNDPHTNVNDAHTGGASVTGTTTENQVLTANTSTLADIDGLGTLHYQWQHDVGGGFVNVGADQATYTLGDADVGGTVRVVISYVDAQGTAEAVTSAATAAIAGVNDPTPAGRRSPARRPRTRS
jgi:methionine-rich copper-binding protein CopC